MTVAIDFETPPNLDAAWNAGVRTLIGYAARNPDWPKVLKRSTVDAWLARGAGAGCALVYEDDGRSEWATISGDTAVIANETADGLGMPTGEAGTCLYAVDYDAQPNEYDRIAAGLDARRAQHKSGRRVGLYGGGRLVCWMLDHGHCDVGWQSGSDSFADTGHEQPTHPGIVLWQRPGAPYTALAGVDDNLILAANHGQWPYTAAPIPQPEDDMFEQADRDAVNQIRQTVVELTADLEKVKQELDAMATSWGPKIDALPAAP